MRFNSKHTTANPFRIVAVVSRCEVCDDDVPGKECSGSSQNDGANCFGDNPYCSTRISGTATGIKVWKGCASEQVCINDWWLGTATNGACSQASVTSGSLTSGVTCTYCCHEESAGGVYCNADLYPQFLSQFPDVTVKPSTTVPTTVQTTTVPMPDNVCPVCVADSSTSQTCRENHHLEACGHPTPYCMTSFYRQPGGYRVEKRCASHADCVLLWLNNTASNSACVQAGLTAGSGSDVECHYCCLNPPAGNVCNQDSHSLIPHYLMDPQSVAMATTTEDYHGGHGHNQHAHTTVPDTSPPPISVTSATTDSSGKHAMTCISCVTDMTSGERCDESNQFDICHQTNHYCMTSFYRSPTTYRVEKRCATREDCERQWWSNTLNKTECMDRDLSPGTGNSLECHYCCFSPDPSVNFCNDDPAKVMPSYLISMGQDTQTQPPSTLPPTTTPSSASSTTAKCQVCLQDPLSDQFCMDDDVQTCGGQGKHFCLNTVTFSGNHGRKVAVSKTCATESMCRTLWDDLLHNNPQCLNQQPTPSHGQHEVICNYCCNSSDVTGTPCNVFDRPPDLVTFGQLSTTMTATTTAATTTTPATTTPSTLPSTTQESMKCAVCDDLCTFFQQEQACPTGFCMTSVTDDQYFSRVVTKSCVSEDDCYRRWWQQTSDRTECQHMLGNGSYPTGIAIQCNFCCQGDRCNAPAVPDKASLYSPHN